MWSDVASIVGTVSVALSVVVVAWQTRRLTQQLRTANNLGDITAVHNQLERLHAIDHNLTRHPELYEVVYGAKPLPDNVVDRTRALILATDLVDIMNYSLMLNTLMPNTKKLQGWEYFIKNTMSNSTVVCEIVAQHPGWWTFLEKAWDDAKRNGDDLKFRREQPPPPPPPSEPVSPPLLEPVP
jgi:hypothetical protein